MIAVPFFLLRQLALIFLGFAITSRITTIMFDRHSCAVPYVIDRRASNKTMTRDFESILGDISTRKFKNMIIEPNKRLVMIGVMTASKYLDTRALMIHSTWGKRVPGKLHFFSSAGSTSNHNLPLVALPGIDDSYPPLKKSFMMLKFMHDNYIDKFEWFMRVDDDLHIKMDKLETFLRSLNSSKPLFIGQMGLVKPQEFNLLGLNHEDNYCMSGTGMIFSRVALKVIAENIRFCITNMMTTHEDVEIARCLKKRANITCTWNQEV